MRTTPRNRRILSDDQVQLVLAWNERMQVWKEKRAQVQSMVRFARANGLASSTLLRLRSKLDRKIELLLRIREWNNALRALLVERTQLETQRDLAREFGVSTTTIRSCVARKGAYKMPPPELYDAVLARRRARIERLKRLNLY